jgi:hypothetical protein
MDISLIDNNTSEEVAKTTLTGESMLVYSVTMNVYNGYDNLSLKIENLTT